MSVKTRFFRLTSALFPAPKKIAPRSKSGSDFQSCMSLVVLCIDVDETTLKRRKDFIKHLKGEYGLRDVLLLNFSDTLKDQLPVYLGHYREVDFFCLDDLNWRSVPKDLIREFCSKPFDVLIDLTSEKCEPLEHLIASSNSKMKIGRRGAVHEKYLDMVLDISESDSEQEFLKQTEYYLSRFSFN